METKEKILVAIDIETTGPHMTKNAIIGIGIYAGRLNGVQIFKKCIKLQKEDRIFDKDCFEQFWSKHKDLLEFLETDAHSIKNGLEIFINALDNLDELFDVILISDSLDFDFGFINYYLAQYLDRLPLAYINGDGNKYRPRFDTDSFSRGIVKMNYDNMWTSDSDIRKIMEIKLSKDIAADHNPANDAEYIYHQHLAILNKIKK